MNSVLISVIYLVSTVVEIILLMQIKKNNEKLEFTRWLLMTIILVIAIDTLAVGIIDVVKIPIKLFTVSIVHILASVLLYFYNKKNDNKQEYYIDKLSVVAEVLISIGLIIYLLKLKDISHAPAFLNVDGAVHFMNAMNLVRGRHLSWMYFAPLVNTVVIDFFSPWMKEIEYVKLFTLVDNLFLILEIEIVWVVINKKLNTRLKKIAGFILIILYTVQYPLSSFLYSFLYWGMAVLLMTGCIILAEDVDRETHRIELLIAWVLMLFTLTMCYMLLAPFMVLVVFLFEIYYEIKVRKTVNIKKVMAVLTIFSIVLGLGLWVGVYKLTGGDISAVFQFAKEQGSIYTEYYWQFVWLAPFIVYDGMRCIQNKKLKFEWIAEIIFVVSVLVLTPMVLKGWLSAYYFYKIYYPLFMFSIVIAASAIAQLIDEKNLLFPSMMVMMVIPFVMNFCFIENKLVSSPANIQTRNNSSNFFYMWNQNEFIRIRTEPNFSKDEMEGISYIMDNFPKDEVPMLAEFDDIVQCYWYMGITGNNSSGYIEKITELENIIEKISNRETEYVCVLRNSAFYSDHEDVLDDYSIVYENTGLIVYSTEKK